MTANTLFVSDDYQSLEIKEPDSVKAARWLLLFLERRMGLVGAALSDCELAAYNDALECVRGFTQIIYVWQKGNDEP